MTHEDEPTLGQGSGLSRRTVVRSAAHAAWMVPAISLITQAPALAASGDTLSFVTPTGSINGGLNQVTINAPVKNTSTHNTAIAANGLVVVVDFTGTGMTPTQVSTAAAGWTSSISGLKVTFTHTAAIAAPTTTPFAPVIKVTGGAAGKSVGLTATAAGYAGATSSITT